MKSTRLLILVLLGLSILGPSMPSANAALEVRGNTYTSPNYGYSVSWDSPWFVALEESKDGHDDLVISDGVSSVAFSFWDTQGADSEEIFEIAHSMLSAQYANVEILSDDSGAPMEKRGADRTFATMRADVSLQDGSLIEVIIYYEVRALDNGVSLAYSASVPSASYGEYPEKWEELLGRIYAPGEIPDSEDAIEVLVKGAGATSIHYVFDSTLDEETRSMITEGMRLAQDFFAETFSQPVQHDLFVTVQTGADPSQSLRVGVTLGTATTFFTGEPGWDILFPLDRLTAVVHEYVHYYEGSQIGLDGLIETPAWFREGLAEYLSMRVITEAGLQTRAAFDQTKTQLLLLAPADPELRELESTIAFQENSLRGYSLSYFAFAFLLENENLDAVDRYFSLVSEGADFEAAFINAFGISRASFYQKFGEHLATMPMDVGPLTDLSGPERERRSSPVSVVKTPESLTAGQQFLFTATTEPGSVCKLSLLVRSDPQLIIYRETYADGEGDLFWLVTMPEEALPGNGTVYFDCESNTETVDIPLVA